MDGINLKAELMALKHEINQLLESDQLNSSKVYELSVKIDDVIIDYYKYSVSLK